MLLTVISFFLILSVLVLVHELGHYVVARLIGVEVEEFGLGLPPRAVGKKIKGTIYSLNWLPIGGFVKLSGEDDEGELRTREPMARTQRGHFFWARTKKERAAMLLAGVAMNFILAVGLTSYLLTKGDMEPAGEVRVVKVLSGSPAEVAGLKENDVVKKVQEKTLTISEDLISITAANEGKPLLLTIVRAGSEYKFTVTPKKDPTDPKARARMGIQISDVTFLKFPWYQAPWEAVKVNVRRAADMVITFGVLIGRIATLKPLQADVAGPIGIAQVTGEAVKFGLDAVIKFMSLLSLNLAVLNILPIPALDGGRLAFIFLEKILGRRVKPAFEKSTHQVGMIILLILILLISIHDILRLTRGG